MGGLHNVIQLCLTNENVIDIMDQHNFEALKSVINIDTQCPTYDNYNSPNGYSKFKANYSYAKSKSDNSINKPHL